MPQPREEEQQELKPSRGMGRYGMVSPAGLFLEVKKEKLARGSSNCKEGPVSEAQPFSDSGLGGPGDAD